MAQHNRLKEQMMKHLLHTLLAGTLLSLPLFVQAEQPRNPDRAGTGTVENLYQKVANGVFMDVRLLRDRIPAETWGDVLIRDSDTGNLRNRLTKVPANTTVRPGDTVQMSIVAQSGTGKSPEDPAYLTGRQFCGPAL